MGKYNYDHIFQNLSIKLRDPQFKLKKKRADQLLFKSIENDDLPLIDLLLKNNVEFSSNILKFIGFSSEQVFLNVLTHVKKTQPDFDWSDAEKTYNSLMTSKVSTVNMKNFILEQIK